MVYPLDSKNILSCSNSAGTSTPYAIKQSSAKLAKTATCVNLKDSIILIRVFGLFLFQ